jgi:hypothetical protein
VQAASRHGEKPNFTLASYLQIRAFSKDGVADL